MIFSSLGRTRARGFELFTISFRPQSKGLWRSRRMAPLGNSGCSKIESHQLSSLSGSLSLTYSLIEAFKLSAVG